MYQHLGARASENGINITESDTYAQYWAYADATTHYTRDSSLQFCQIVMYAYVL